jgi:hypothetical protein
MTLLAVSITDATRGRAELREEDLASFVADVTGLDATSLRVAARTADDVVVAALGSHATLHARPGGWVLRLGDAAATGGLATAVTAAVLAVAGLDQLPALVLPAVLPLLIDLDRVSLTPGEEHLLAEIRLQPLVVNFARTPRKLYEELPDDLRDQISLVDFLDFLDRLIGAGEADAAPGDRVIVRDAHDPAWVRIRVE